MGKVYSNISSFSLGGEIGLVNENFFVFAV